MNFFTDIWKSYLGLPTWVKIWVFLILVPVNIASIWFIGNPGSSLVVSFAIAGMLFNAIPIWFDRGFSSAMAIPHVIFWAPLTIILVYYLMISEVFLMDNYRYFLITLLVCNLFSLFFDIPDSFKWLRDRKKVI
tara:strand:+ start:433 stop:834 length:402 start_codon:yes stop_codon:yes gene_type:complete